MRIFLLHTVRPGLDRFEAMVLNAFPAVQIFNLLDDFWIRELPEKGEFTEECQRHLLDVCAAMEGAGADLIVCTCSSLTPYWDLITPRVGVPIVAIDRTLAEQTLKCGSRIMVVATAKTAAVSAADQIRARADGMMIKCEIDLLCCDEAGQIMRAGGDMARHDALLLSRADEMKGYDVVVLAQLSTSHLAGRLNQLCGSPVITTPGLCIEDLKNYM